MTTPLVPSTVMSCPVRRVVVASPVPTTAGMLCSRATSDAQAARLPPSVTSAAARANSGVQAGAAEDLVGAACGEVSGPVDHAPCQPPRPASPGSASPRAQPTAAPRSESQDADDLRTMPCSENGPYLNMRRSARQQAGNALDAFNNSFNNL
jgi:hypothetical protein